MENKSSSDDVDSKEMPIGPPIYGQDLKMVCEYFKRIKYPPVKDVRLAMGHRLGYVAVVTFNPRTMDGLAPFSCYAIVRPGEVVGYPMDFWTDADKYRLVLKQHLGMLEMDAFDRGEHPSQVKPESAPEVAPSTSVANETMDAVVGRYEGLIETLNAEIDRKGAEVLAEKQKSAALAEKLSKIGDVLSGQSDVVSSRPGPTPEECMIDQNIDDPFGDNGSAEVSRGSMDELRESSSYQYDMSGSKSAYPIGLGSDRPSPHSDQFVQLAIATPLSRMYAPVDEMASKNKTNP